MSIEEKEKLCKELQDEIGRYSYLPYSGKKFLFERVTHKDLEKMHLTTLKMIQSISKNWEKVLEYNGRIEPYTGKIPDTFIKENCFVLVFDEYFTMCCYIDIEKIDDACIVFDVFPNFVGNGYSCK